METAHGQGRHYLPDTEMKGYRVDLAQAASEWGMMLRGMMETAHGQGRHYLPDTEMKGYRVNRVDLAQAASEWGMMLRGMMETAHGQGRQKIPDTEMKGYRVNRVDFAQAASERRMIEAGEGLDSGGILWGIGCWQQTESSASISTRQTTHSLGDKINWPGKTLPCRRLGA